MSRQISNRSSNVEDASPGLKATLLQWARLPAARVVGGLFGAWLAWHGATALPHEPDHRRGAASAIVIGAIVVYWAITARIPEWVRRRR